MPTLVYDTQTHAILVIGPARDDQGNVILPQGVSAATTDITATEATKLSQPGSYTVDPMTGVVTVVPPGPETPAVVEYQTARGDLETQYQAAITRLDQIITAASPTNAQVIQAVRDLATIQRRTLRFIRAELA
jgi:hypothetical protein